MQVSKLVEWNLLHVFTISVDLRLLASSNQSSLFLWHTEFQSCEILWNGIVACDYDTNPTSSSVLQVFLKENVIVMYISLLFSCFFCNFPTMFFAVVMQWKGFEMIDLLKVSTFPLYHCLSFLIYLLCYRY